MHRKTTLCIVLVIGLSVLAGCTMPATPSPTAVSSSADPATASAPAENPTAPPADDEPPSIERSEGVATPTPTPPAPTPAPTVASSTPAPTTSSSASAPTIVSFTAQPTEITQGDEVTFSWQATGGTLAYLQWTDNFGRLAGMSVDPNGGSATFAPVDSRINLRVENSVGASSETVELTIACAHEWAPELAGNPPTSRCPWEPAAGAGAYQPFENGFMIWFGPERVVYVFFNTGSAGSGPRYASYTDQFNEGDPESDPEIVPPAGLYQPTRGFGLVWRSQAQVRDGLGWATAPEVGFNTWQQSYSERASHSHLIMMQGIDAIYRLNAFSNTWEVYVP